ncbi:hypothetical protein HDV00_006445 [Rhizophlyctis rosea]|nr:hypothetical protein HDV00_006445 [Rhizophlyctis rosea]
MPARAISTILFTVIIALTTVTAQTLQYTSGVIVGTHPLHPVRFNHNIIHNNCGVRIDYDDVTRTQTPIYPPTDRYHYHGPITVNDVVDGLLFGVGTGHVCYARSTAQHDITRGYECTISNCQRRPGPRGEVCSLDVHCTPPARVVRPTRPTYYSNAPQRVTYQNPMPRVVEEAAVDSFDADPVVPVIKIIPL